ALNDELNVRTARSNLANLFMCSLRDRGGLPEGFYGKMFTTCSVPTAAGGNAPLAHVPRCDPPLICTFGGCEPPVFVDTAACPAAELPMSTLVNLYPGGLDATTRIPKATVPKSMSLPVPYPQRPLSDVSGESVSSIPVKREKTKKSCTSRDR